MGILNPKTEGPVPGMLSLRASFLSSAGGTGDFGRAVTARGKWRISDDGRYCVFIEWRGIPNEEWCRYILQTNDGYYGVNSDSVATARVFKMDIKK